MVETVSLSRCHGGTQGFYRHASREIGLSMGFSVFTPPAAAQARVPILLWLSGLTCTEENFTIKAGAQRLAADAGFLVVAPDTSPRDTGIEGEDNDWAFGTGAGFYLDATVEPWFRHYRMESYIVRELPESSPMPFPAIRRGWASSVIPWAAMAHCPSPSRIPACSVRFRLWRR